MKEVHATGAAARLDYLVYSFAHLDAQNLCVLGDPWADFQQVYTADRSVDGVADGSNQPLKGHFNQLKKLKKLHPNLKMTVSIGGANEQNTARLKLAAATPESRTAFVASFVNTFLKGNLPGQPAGTAAGIFDGVDLDWEFPQASDKVNLTALVLEFRKQLDALQAQTGKYYEMTAWVPANEANAVHWENAMLAKFDFLIVQGYDLHGSWEKTTNFSSALDTVDKTKTWWTCARAIKAWTDKGVPANKLVLGVPFYGHSWTNVGSTNNGLWQPGVPQSPVIYRLAKAKPGTVFRKPTMGAWKYDAAGKFFYSFDDAGVMAEKVAWVISKGLLGVSTWELSQDSNGELIKALKDALDAEQDQDPEPIPEPGPVDDQAALIQRLTAGDGEHRMLMPELTVQAAKAANCDLAAACVMLVLETSGGRNVFGNDATRQPAGTTLPYTKGGAVTESAYRGYKSTRDQYGYQGVGPCQLTWYSFQDEADARGGCWVPEHNMFVGLKTLGESIRREGFQAAFSRYNTGGPAPSPYSAKAMSLLPRWQEIVGG